MIKPRRFFGLLCAHEWDYWGDLEQTFVSGTIKQYLVLRCKHCGDVKYPRKPRV